METIKTEELSSITGAVINFAIGYAAGKALDYILSGEANADGVSRSELDFTQSNEYFLNNRDKFNLLY